MFFHPSLLLLLLPLVLARTPRDKPRPPMNYYSCGNPNYTTFCCLSEKLNPDFPPENGIYMARTCAQSEANPLKEDKRHCKMHILCCPKPKDERINFVSEHLECEAPLEDHSEGPVKPHPVEEEIPWEHALMEAHHIGLPDPNFPDEERKKEIRVKLGIECREGDWDCLTVKEMEAAGLFCPKGDVECENERMKIWTGMERKKMKENGFGGCGEKDEECWEDMTIAWNENKGGLWV